MGVPRRGSRPRRRGRQGPDRAQDRHRPRRDGPPIVSRTPFYGQGVQPGPAPAPGPGRHRSRRAARHRQEAALPPAHRQRRPLPSRRAHHDQRGGQVRHGRIGRQHLDTEIEGLKAPP